MLEKTLVSVVGPTAIGKTRLAIGLAKHFHTEIISADSRQFYKEMTIGTAVPSPDELRAAKHNFIQHKSVHDEYSVGDFERDALLLLSQLFEDKGKVVMVGGSGLYVDAVVSGLDKFPTIAPQIRQDLNNTLAEKGLIPLQQDLKRLDPDYFSRVDIANPHRVIRALEVCKGTGSPYSFFLGKKKAPRPFKNFTVGLMADRKIIYERIDQRVDRMIKQGLLEEARSLFPFKDLNALQTVGYKELFGYLNREYDLDFAIAEIKKNTRRFAKRQMTWYRKNKEILWLAHDLPIEEGITIIESKLKIIRNA